jgi:hypothetical protein
MRSRRGSFKVLKLVLQSLTQVPQGLDLIRHTLTVLGNISLHLLMPLLDELDVLDLRLKCLDLKLLGLDL